LVYLLYSGGFQWIPDIPAGICGAVRTTGATLCFSVQYILYLRGHLLIISTIYYIETGHPLLLSTIYYIPRDHTLLLSTIYFIFEGPPPYSQYNILY
jgi:hypothetical protein